MNDSTDSGRARALQDLCALVDGECDATALGGACAQWRTDANLRASWHAYHLIGDVMRSDELASDAGHDAAFVRELRERLAREPVILAPSPAAEPAPVVRARPRISGWSWKAPAAVAAGFVAVAGVLLATQGMPPGGGATPGVGLLAQSLGAAAGTTGSPATEVASPAAESQVLVADGQLVRDARLQRYLAAHKQFGGSSALGGSSGFMRAAVSLPPER